MFTTNAIFHRKESSFETTSCFIEKAITLSDTEYDIFRGNMLKDYDFISDNKESMFVDTNGTTHCLLVLGENKDDGVLIDSQGFNYYPLQKIIQRKAAKSLLSKLFAA